MKLAVRFRYYKAVTPSCSIIYLDDEQWKEFLAFDDAEKRKDYMVKLMGKEHLDIKELWWIPLDDQDELEVVSEKNQDDYMNGIKRYFLVIRELHEMGYELIRVCPCLSPSGTAWRCATTVKKYTLKNCGAIYRSNEPHTAADTHSGQFKWGSCNGLTPHEIALQFIEHYPHIAKWGKGKDPEYKEWFKKANDLAQRGYIFFAFGDWCSCFDHKHRMLLEPEPPTGEYLPFPPAGEVE